MHEVLSIGGGLNPIRGREVSTMPVPVLEGGSVLSTPFVILLHTFTGKFLCGFYLRSGHPFSNDFSKILASKPNL